METPQDAHPAIPTPTTARRSLRPLVDARQVHVPPLPPPPPPIAAIVAPTREELLSRLRGKTGKLSKERNGARVAAETAATIPKEKRKEVARTAKRRGLSAALAKAGVSEPGLERVLQSGNGDMRSVADTVNRYFTTPVPVGQSEPQ